MSYAVSFYNQFHAIERRSADELADALPFMKWAPSATCGANIARHGAVQLGRMARVEYEIWGGNQRLIQLLRTVAGQVSRKSLYAAVYVGYILFVAVALAYSFGKNWIDATVEDSQQVSVVQQASTDVMADMEATRTQASVGAELGDDEEPPVEPLTVDNSNYSIGQLRRMCSQKGLGVRNPVTKKAWTRADAMEVLGLA